jgi:mannitol/fructose-specific phosphotransferase system IIA component (Ntr-type)
MRLTRYIKPPQVRLEMRTLEPDEIPEGWTADRYLWSVKEKVLEELVELFDVSGKVVNPSKLLTDLINREKMANTAIGEGLAIPHVRTMQARDFTLCFARSSPGLTFGAADQQRVHLFVGLIAPPYDDRLYLEVERELALIFKSEQARETLLTTGDVHEVIKIIADFESWGR